MEEWRVEEEKDEIKIVVVSGRQVEKER